MNLLRVLSDGLILTGISIGASLLGGSFLQEIGSEDNKKENNIKWNVMYLMGIIYTVFSVFFIYEGQENSDYFFWHPYLAWSIANLGYIIYSRRFMSLKRIIFERIILWQVIVNTVFSGLALCAGWLMKLYIR